MSEAKAQYKEALRRGREGHASTLGPLATFNEVKPDFYADARILSEDALRFFKDLRQSSPPYGLVNKAGNAITNFGGEQPWYDLSNALSSSAHYAFENATPSISACPYHAVLSDTLGGTTTPLRPFDGNERGLDTLRNVVTPGGELNSPLFVALLRRMPSLQRLHGTSGSTEEFARASSTLLREPLAHPQQWAASFVCTLGTISELVHELTDPESGPYLNDTLALQVTKIEEGPGGSERLAWAIPTEELTLRSARPVADRTQGNEFNLSGDHVVKYPAGTRLIDMPVTEPTIGCPGNLFAEEVWQRAIDVIVSEGLWPQPV